MKSNLDVEHFAAVVERYTTPLLEDSMSNEEEGYEMNTKHRPGQWHVNHTNIGTFIVGRDEDNIPVDIATVHGEDDTNAALLAAAPTLRTACEDVRAWGIELASLLPDERELRFRQLWPKVNDVLRDAIAEAEPSPPP